MPRALKTTFVVIGIVEVSPNISEVYDTNEFHRFIPGIHIPVYPEEYLGGKNVDYCLLLAWNYKDQILGKIKGLVKKNTKIVIPYPKFELISCG